MNRIIIAGKGGTGKDYLRKLLEKNSNMKYCISHTSRPIRRGEIDGIDYHFVNREYFKKNEDKFYEYVEFNNWFYGTSKDEFNKSNLLIMTPKGIDKLKPEDREESYIIYLDIEESIRKTRMESRKDADNTERRLYTDRIDFENFTNYDMKIKNPSFGDAEVNEILIKISMN